MLGEPVNNARLRLAPHKVLHSSFKFSDALLSVFAMHNGSCRKEPPGRLCRAPGHAPGEPCVACIPTRNPQSMENGSGLALCMTLDDTDRLTSNEAVGLRRPAFKGSRFALDLTIGLSNN